MPLVHSATMGFGEAARLLWRRLRNKHETYSVIIHDGGYTPMRATDGSAGIDITAPENILVPPGKMVVVPLAISNTPPPGTYTRTVLRSSIAKKHALVIPADVIDANYTGEIHLLSKKCGTGTCTH